MRCGRGMRRRAIVTVGLAIISFLWLPVFAAGAEESGWGWIETIGRWFNLLILFGVIYYFSREPISRFLDSRREGIRKEIDEANLAREEAEQKLASMEAKMRDLEGELEAMRRQAQEEAAREEKRILDQAAAESRKIVATAEREIEGLTRAARESLRDYAVELSMEMAIRKIRAELDSKAQRRVIDRFLVQLTDASTEVE